MPILNEKLRESLSQIYTFSLSMIPYTQRNLEYFRQILRFFRFLTVVVDDSFALNLKKNFSFFPFFFCSMVQLDSLILKILAGIANVEIELT